MDRIYILLICFSVVLKAVPGTELTDGYYVDVSGADSIEVESSDDQLTLSLENGSRINFNMMNGKYRYKKLSSDDFLELKIESDNKFRLIDNNDSVGMYSLYRASSFFNKLIAILVSSALLFSVFQAYLKLNKIFRISKFRILAKMCLYFATCV